MTVAEFDIFLAAPPGLEPILAEEARAQGFEMPVPVPGGVVIRGGRDEVWRANLVLRGAGRVLVRVAAFRALHLAQLDRRARRVDWGAFLRRDVAVSVEAVCRKSRIYHGRAAAQRVARAIGETLGAPAGAGGVCVRVRIEDDLATVSLDASGAPLHRRGHKLAVGKAPMRETLAALFLRACGHDGRAPVVDPMCGSGTIPIEAAEIACGLAPGRSRAFDFERFADFDAEAYAALRAAVGADGRGRDAGDGIGDGIGQGRSHVAGGDAEHGTELGAGIGAGHGTGHGIGHGIGYGGGVRFHGFDRDAGAVRMAVANAERAGVAPVTRFVRQATGDLVPPEGPKGLVLVNPPYGARIGERKPLFALYGSLGRVLAERFSGWRVGIVTSDAGLARATGLPFLPPGPPVAHGPFKVTLWRCDPLA